MPSFGVLGVGGTVSLVVGSVMMTREVPGVRVGLGVILPVAIALAAIVLFLGRLALQAQRLPPVTGARGDCVGEAGGRVTPLAPDAPGQVDVHGEIWRAISREPLAAGRAGARRRRSTD